MKARYNHIMMDYDSSDDEMATRFEQGAGGGVIRSVLAEEENGDLNGNHNGLQLSNNTTTGEDGSLPNNNDKNSIVIASQAPPAAAAVSRSTRKKRRRHQPQNADDDDNNDESVEVASTSAAASSSSSKPPSMEQSSNTTSTDRDRHDETNQESNKSNNNNNNDDSKKQSLSSFAPCRKCGRLDFCTAIGARRHEAVCDGTNNPKGPWKCPTCGRDSFLTSQAFSGHYRCCNKVVQLVRQEAGGAGAGAVITPTLLSLGRGSHDIDADDDGRSSPLEVARSKLSNFNQLVLECIELFAATQADVNVQVTGNGKRHISIGNLGIRCVHCARRNMLPIGSISYTADLTTLPHVMYVMVQRHLLVTCAHIDDERKRQLRETKTNSTSQSMTKGNIGLPTYLRLLAKIHGLADDGKKLGVRYRVSTLAITVREEETRDVPAVAAAQVAAPSEGAARAVPTNDINQNGNQGSCHYSKNSLDDDVPHNQHQLLPSGETRPIHCQQDYYNPPVGRFLEDVGEEVEI